VRDADERFHKEWLGLAQPVEGLVFSVPALSDAQIAPKVRPTLTAELEAHLEETDQGPALRNVRAFFETFLGYTRPGTLVGRDALPAELAFYAQEGRQENRRELRILYAPTGESSAHLTFRFKDLKNHAGRPVAAALELLLHAKRTYGADPQFTFEGLLRESRLRQADVLALRRLHEEMDRAVLDAYGWTDVAVPPFCARTDAERAALQEFEDEVIDRLHVLNAERAREEARITRRGGRSSAPRRVAPVRKLF
jgi:hypothetical protein